MDVVGYAIPLLGGALIGLAASLHLYTHGRIAGISSILAESLTPQEPAWRIHVAFVTGLVGTGAVAALVTPSAFGTQLTTSTPILIAAGLLVGIGTRVGSGCTSGHGVCGLSRLSTRSLAAVATFMLVAMLTVAAVKGPLGGFG